jgi:hypothetical protein
MARRGMGRLLGVMVGFLVLGGVGASAAHYLQEPYNPGFLEFPTVVALHVVLGGVYLALAPFQFVKRIKSRHLGYHLAVMFPEDGKFGPDALIGWPNRLMIVAYRGCGDGAAARAGTDAADRVPRSRGRLDLISSAMSLAAVLAVIYGLKQIAAYGLEWLPVFCILVGLAIGAVFVRRQ